MTLPAGHGTPGLPLLPPSPEPRGLGVTPTGPPGTPREPPGKPEFPPPRKTGFSAPRKFPPRAGAPPGGPPRDPPKWGVFGGLFCILLCAKGIYPPIPPKMAKKGVQKSVPLLSRLGELLNTQKNVHSRGVFPGFPSPGNPDPLGVSLGRPPNLARGARFSTTPTANYGECYKHSPRRDAMLCRLGHFGLRPRQLCCLYRAGTVARRELEGGAGPSTQSGWLRSPSGCVCDRSSLVLLRHLRTSSSGNRAASLSSVGCSALRPRQSAPLTQSRTRLRFAVSIITPQACVVISFALTPATTLAFASMFSPRVGRD